MTACLSSISIAFYDILAQTYVTIKILRCESDLRAVIGPLMGLPAVKKLGVAKCSGRKFRSEFFTRLFEHFCAYLRHRLAEHADLGIT